MAIVCGLPVLVGRLLQSSGGPKSLHCGALIVVRRLLMHARQLFVPLRGSVVSFLRTVQGFFSTAAR